MKQWLAISFALVCGLAFTGCGESGSKTLRFSGKVTLDGKPIPFGEIIITPDSSKNNSGPQGRADIKDGVFDTKGAFGVGSGPMMIRVNGMSGPGGKTLCEYEMAIDLPAKSSTLDIDVPAKDAHNANKKPKANANDREI